MTTRRPDPTTVAVIDNQETARLGVLNMLAEHADEFIAAGAFEEVHPLHGLPSPPHVVILDLRLGRDDILAIDAIAPLVERGSAVLLHTSEERPAMLRSAVLAGCHGISLKNDGVHSLYLALRDVACGGFACSSVLAEALVSDPLLAASLTPREVGVLECLHDGLTRDQIARRLGIAAGTIKTHLESVRAKYLGLGRTVTNSTSLVREARRDGWID